MGEMVVNSRAVARFKFSRFDKFEARNRPHLHILVRCVALKLRKNRVFSDLVTSYFCIVY